MDDALKVQVQIAVDRDLVAGARAAGLDIGEVAEAALRNSLGEVALTTEASKAERVEQWRREHARAIAHHNELIDREGMFGEEWRTF